MTNIYVERSEDGSEYWYRDGLLHREDGPAIILAGGTRKWYKDGKLHREDGPSVIWYDGAEQWYKDDKLHREDGPAAIWDEDDKSFYLNGTKYEPLEWLIMVGELHHDT